MSDIFNPTIHQITATNKAYSLREKTQNDNDLSQLLGLSKVTLYTRFKNSNWKDQEILFIEYLTNPKFKEFTDALNILSPKSDEIIAKLAEAEQKRNEKIKNLYEKYKTLYEETAKT